MREPRWKALKKCTKKNTVASAPVTELELEVLGLVGQRHDENDSAGLCLSLSLSLSLSAPNRLLTGQSTVSRCVQEG